MDQTSLDDDELFGEAASEMESDVRSSLAAAREELPDANAIWETDADNVLGVLNGLKSSLDVGEAADDLRDAKKWFTVGKRANAFEDPDAIAADIEDVEETIADLEAAAAQVNELTTTIPALRGALEDDTEAEGGTAEAAQTGL